MGCINRFMLGRLGYSNGVEGVMNDMSGKFPEYKLLGESELFLTIHSAPIDDRKKLRELITSSGETINSGRKTIRVAGETIKSGIRNR